MRLENCLELVEINHGLATVPYKRRQFCKHVFTVLSHLSYLCNYNRIECLSVQTN